jgi:hypothetical protein
MGPTAASEDRHIRELSDAEGWELFDEAAKTYLGISGEEFMSRWYAGYYENPDQPGVMSVIMLLPFALDHEPEH